MGAISKISEIGGDFEISEILFIENVGVTVVSRGGRLYVRRREEFDEIDGSIRVVIASGFGFVITSEAIRDCARRHVEVIITDASQNFTAIYANYAGGDASRRALKIRERQFAALADARKRVDIAKAVIGRRILAEAHEPNLKRSLISELAECGSAADVRLVEAKSAQAWWRRWKDFELKFIKGCRPPAQWRTFSTRYIGRRHGQLGELATKFAARPAQTPLQAMHNFAISITAARLTRVIVARGLDPCFGFLHDGRKPGRYSLAWDAIEVLRPGLAEAVFRYAGDEEFGLSDFAQQEGVVRLSQRVARELQAVVFEAVPVGALVKAVKVISDEI